LSIAIESSIPQRVVDSRRSKRRHGAKEASPTGNAPPLLSRDVALALEGWFSHARRDLPWRSNRTAYRVWLSEVMLQQTQVSRVVEYFERFVARFPDVFALAAADEDDVLALWSGLGYYSRGRNLHRAARVVVDRFGGLFPTTAATLRALPGIGAYTGAAIATFSAGERVAVVDGNVLRVLSRLTDQDEPVDRPAGRRRLELVAEALVNHAADPATYNEAIMECGALVCRPQRPACEACPLSPWCAARAVGTVSQRPVKSRGAARTALRVACVVIEVEGRLYLERRNEGGLFRGLWEPVSVVLDDGDDAVAAWASVCVARSVAPPSTMTPVVVERTLTHRELRFEVAHVASSVAPVVPAGVDGQLFSLDELRGKGIASAVRAIFRALNLGAG
jgi:A/G-specific adenine glycosylase